MTDGENNVDIATELAGVVAVMNGDMGIKAIIKNAQLLYQRQSSYFFLELCTQNDAEE